ncbi:MAG: sensor histidine kinase [Spirochaetia bacterium]|nr:sensor histidine kinase [Spirochaetia bacterium]
MNCSKNEKIPLIKKGFIDLSAWDFTKKGNFELKGEWEFYWNELLTYDDFQKELTPPMTGFFKIPQSWNKYKINGKKIGSDGYATYRLRLKTTNSKDILCLSAKTNNSSYNIFIDNRLILFNAKIGKTKETSEKKRIYTMGCFLPEKEEISLILQTSNFHYATGGPTIKLTMGSSADTTKSYSLEMGSNILLVAIYLSMIMYHFAIYFFRKKDKSTLYFGIFCGLFFLRQIVYGEIFLTQIFPSLSWEFLVMIEYFTFYALLPVFMAYLRELYPKEVPVFFLRSVTVSFFIFSLFLIMPPKIFSYTKIPYQIIYILSFLLGIRILYQTIIQKRHGAKIMLVGLTIAFVSVINDILLSNELINTIVLSGYGNSAFVFSQAYLLSLKSMKAFEYIDEMKKTEKLKADTERMMRHDMKNSLSGIIGLSELMLEDKKLSSKHREYLSLINDSAADLTAVINNYMAIFKMEEGTYKLNSKDFDLLSIFKELNKNFSKKLKEKELNMVIKLYEDKKIENESLPIKGEKVYLKTMLENLLENAVQASPEKKSIIIDIQFNNSFYIINIHNYGVVPENIRGSFFEKYATSGKKQGTGLGTYSARLIARVHGGDISFTSSEKEGTTITILLPCN